MMRREAFEYVGRRSGGGLDERDLHPQPRVPRQSGQVGGDLAAGGPAPDDDYSRGRAGLCGHETLPDAFEVGDRLYGDRAVRAARLATEAEGDGVVPDGPAVFEEQGSVPVQDLRDATQHETAPAPFYEMADADAVLAGLVGAGEHARRHAGVVEVLRRVDGDHVEAAPGEFCHAPQRVEVRVAAAGQGYRGSRGICAHAHRYIPYKEYVSGMLGLATQECRILLGTIP